MGISAVKFCGTGLGLFTVSYIAQRFAEERMTPCIVRRMDGEVTPYKIWKTNQILAVAISGLMSCVLVRFGMGFQKLRFGILFAVVSTLANSHFSTARQNTSELRAIANQITESDPSEEEISVNSAAFGRQVIYAKKVEDQTHVYVCCPRLADALRACLSLDILVIIPRAELRRNVQNIAWFFTSSLDEIERTYRLIKDTIQERSARGFTPFAPRRSTKTLDFLRRHQDMAEVEYDGPDLCYPVWNYRCFFLLCRSNDTEHVYVNAENGEDNLSEKERCELFVLIKNLCGTNVQIEFDNRVTPLVRLNRIVQKKNSSKPFSSGSWV